MTSIIEIIKSNITNSAMLGALSKVTKLYTLDEIKEEFHKEFANKQSKFTTGKIAYSDARHRDEILR